MSLIIVIGEEGRLFIEKDEQAKGDSLGAKARRTLEESFLEASEEGLLLLGGEFLEAEVGETLAWWRELVVACLEGFLQGGAKTAPPEWQIEKWRGWLLRCPPMVGAERLTMEMVEGLWRDLAKLVAEKSQENGVGDIPEFLKSLHPFWENLGKVTFHVAENKGNEDQPFAFLATYAKGVSGEGGDGLRHVPLGKALQEYAEDPEGLKHLLEPVRKACAQSELIAQLFKTKRLFQPQAWTSEQAYHFLKETAKLEHSGLALRLPNWWRKRARPQVQVTLEGKEKKSSVGLDAMFGFSVDLALGGEKLTKEEWEEILEGDDPLIRLKGQWVEVDRGKLQEVLEHWRRVEGASGDGVSFAEGMRWLAGFGAGSGLEEGFQEEDREWFTVQAGEALRKQLERIRSAQKGENTKQDQEAGRYVQATLRPYQEIGVSWLRELSALGLGACLADDMGLGKTLQTIAYLGWLHLEKKSSAPPSLLVVPASLLGNWRAELERFCPELKFFIAHRSQTEKDQLENFFNQPKDTLKKRNTHLAITTYQMVKRQDSLKKMPWNAVILDEAQAIKNPAAAQTKEIKQLQAKSRIALSGTPVENRLGDLWSLFDFLNPGLLGKSSDFAEALKLMSTEARSDYSPLKKLTTPYILRRLKTDKTVAPDLPAKIELKVHCPLKKDQAALYRSGVAQLAKELQEAEGIEKKGLVLSYLLRFKQLCNHPALWLGDGDYQEARSGKLQRLHEICEEIVAKREKVLVFTQFREMCDPLVASLEPIFGHGGFQLHGGTPVKSRQKLVQQFQDFPGASFFVLSLKAGGTGLNLTGANHVIHFDRWWNPAVENQATDRAFRIGQKRKVLVHKFICPGTIEERIDRLIDEKKELAEQVVGTGDGALSLLTQMDNDDLLNFISLDLKKVLS